MFRAAATSVALAVVAFTFSAFAVTQAGEGTSAAAVARYDVTDHVSRIPEPDRTKNKSTAWRAHYNREHHERLYFATGKKPKSVKKHYKRQSSGRYWVERVVTDWVKVPYNEARYGINVCGRTNCSGVRNVVSGGLNDWVGSHRGWLTPLLGHSDPEKPVVAGRVHSSGSQTRE
jgi:hypothetical protein